MSAVGQFDGSVKLIVDSLVSTLVTVHHWPDCSFIRMPLLYPSGDNVTVKIERIDDEFRVSDHGFAFRQCEDFSDIMNFSSVAEMVADEAEIEHNAQMIFVEVDAGGLYSAVCEVALASYKIAAWLRAEAAESG